MLAMMKQGFGVVNTIYSIQKYAIADLTADV